MNINEKIFIKEKSMSNFFAAIHSGFNNLTHSAEHLMIIFAIFFASWGLYKVLPKPNKVENSKK